MQTKQRSKRRRVLMRYTAEDRERLIGECETSGMTRGEFCAKRRINLQTFYGWFKKQRKPGTPRFAQVAVPAGVSAAPIEIELGRGVCIRLRDASHLKDVVLAVREVAAC